MSGMNLSFAGHGNVLRGRASSLIISIKVLPHEIYQRDNHNVRYTMPITLNQAINGDVI
jgi:DnaJ-class molecular chaperone